MNRQLPDHIAPWLVFPRSPMELAASFGLTVLVGTALAVLFN